MFQRILVATDGSQHARKAVELGADLASRYGASLVLVHVLREKGMPDELRHLAEVEHLLDTEGARQRPPDTMRLHLAGVLGDGEQGEAMWRAYEALGRRLLESAERTAREKGVTQVETRLVTGDAPREILGCAEAEHADLIIIGSRGLGDVKGLLMGSVSHKVSQLAKCTCITVK